MFNQIKKLYEDWSLSIRLKKFKLLHRWGRFNNKIEDIERSRKLLESRLERFDRCYEFAIKRNEVLNSFSEESKVCFQQEHNHKYD